MIKIQKIMSERIHIPKTSAEVANQVFLEATTNTQAFIRTVSSRLEEKNPHLLEGMLFYAAGVSMIKNTSLASQILAGSFFRYDCLVKELAKTNQVPFFIPPETLANSGKSFFELTINANRAGVNHETRTRQMIMKLEMDDKFVGESLKGALLVPPMTAEMEKAEAFIHAAYVTQLALEKTPANTSIEKAPEIIIAETKIPVVRKSVVIPAILEAIIDREGFIEKTEKALAMRSPDLLKSLNEACKSPSFLHPELTRLFANFELHCLMEEYKQRGRRFPHIRQRHIGIEDPQVASALKLKNYQKAAQLASERFLDIFREIRDTNPHLYWGAHAFLSPLYEEETEDREKAACSALINVYKHLKTALNTNGR